MASCTARGESLKHALLYQTLHAINDEEFLYTTWKRAGIGGSLRRRPVVSHGTPAQHLTVSFCGTRNNPT
jgi:hypothetical protein